MTTERVIPVTEFELVRLAIELARLRGEKEPARFLDEAARLLTEARFALGREQTRPEREAKERSNEAIRVLADSLSETVPFAKLCRSACDSEKIGASALSATENFEFRGENGLIHFVWRVYRDEREFKTLLEKHVKRVYGEVSKALASLRSTTQTICQSSSAEVTTNNASWGKAAVSLLADRYWFPDAWREKFLAEKSSEAEEALAKEYVTAAIQAFSERLWHMAKADQLDAVTLFAISQTRQGTYKSRGRKPVA